jgi:hypothetical protein
MYLQHNYKIDLNILSQITQAKGYRLKARLKMCVQPGFRNLCPTLK